MIQAAATAVLTKQRASLLVHTAHAEVYRLYFSHPPRLQPRLQVRDGADCAVCSFVVSRVQTMLNNTGVHA